MPVQVGTLVLSCTQRLLTLLLIHGYEGISFGQVIFDPQKNEGSMLIKAESPEIMTMFLQTMPHDFPIEIKSFKELTPSTAPGNETQ